MLINDAVGISNFFQSTGLYDSHKARLDPLLLFRFMRYKLNPNSFCFKIIFCAYCEKIIY